jgi:hypothetical protein
MGMHYYNGHGRGNQEGPALKKAKTHIHKKIEICLKISKEKAEDRGPAGK